MRRRILLSLMLSLALLAGLFNSPVGAQSSAQTEGVQALLASMTPAEKIGQLFLITFTGTDLDQDSQIYDLITNEHIGGVVLRADHNNFVDIDTTANAFELITGLQQLAWQKTQPQTNLTRANPASAYIPLYVGIAPAGDGKTDEIQSGLTALPNPMALGATWSASMAQDVGKITGAELSALGFNLYLGPALDVVDTTDINSAAYAGTQTFGGDPYWVGEMGKAFINGVHTGSNGRISVIAQHFPGLGGADRPPLDEVSTIQKSLEQLKQIELAPYIAVTSGSSTTEQTDGLMVSPIRFQGFQGNIRATTRPISLDQTALEQLLAVEPIATWRNAGGLTISDSLGSRAIRYFFDPTGITFDSLNVARTAFLAGNDMLYLNDFRAYGDESDYQTIKRTCAFFLQKYQEDVVFKGKVDASVSRILQAKMRLYGEFSPENVLPSEAGLAVLGQGSETSFAVAQEAVTLVSPSAEFLNAVLPEAPSTYENMVVFSDSRSESQCSTCRPKNSLSVRAFQDALLNLYGSQGTNQLSENKINSYTFQALTKILDGGMEPDDQLLTESLRLATWVVFNLQDLDPEVSSSYALKRILSERIDLLRDKRVIVFAYGAPYYLDSTEISKVTAYYCLYSHSEPFLEVAARVLMHESQARGSLPVSLSVVGYDLNKQTSPDPNQVIPISLLSSSLPGGTETPAPTAETPVPLFRSGETVRIQAGASRDHNKHLVPDGTVVRFTVRLAPDSLIIAQPEATTIGGLATIEYRIEREGIFEVIASSEPAVTSGMLILNTQGGSAQLVMPTPTPTLSPTATPQPTPTQQIISTSNPYPNGIASGYPRIEDWLLMIMLLTLGFAAAYGVGFYWWKGRTWAIRSGLCTIIGGLVAYLLLTLGVPDLVSLVQKSGAWFIFEVVAVGLLFGWIASFIWWLAKNSPR